MTSRPDDADPRVDGASEPVAEPTPPVDDPSAARDDAIPADVDAGADAADDDDDQATVERELRPVTVDRADVQVRARLVPRYGRFMVLGGILGAIAGWLWSRLGSSGPWLNAGPVIDTSSIVPFLVGVGALVGIVLGAVLAIVLDRLVGRRRRTVTAERTRHHRGDVED
ncbi:hypothetical protein GCM10009846_03130 [Agrococcus versicolor]|uniref:Potassium transporter Trk n=1 Tax=Agrococcus versicolor TaxID=501482 RepID=A0ABN3AKJ9_9MICO